MPGLDVRVVERRLHPVPVAAHKVGESTVEIGAHYLAETLRLREHLDSEHVRKFGFRFFFSEGARDLCGVTELGASRILPTPAWQIDRGIFENFLAEEAVRRGVRFEDGTAVKRIEIDPDAGHRVEIERNGAREHVSARWLIDASGRAGLLKRKLDLAEDNAHDANAVWFRLDARLEVDDWVADPAWRARCDPPARWRSTNHMCGPGYWLWLIPLGSGAHSVGIVADAKMHPLETMNTFERALGWIAEHQPAVYDRIRETLERAPEALMDFAFFRNFSYGCRQVFSRDRWAITGEAGWFLDPFYSPGSDFIAISNTYITELIRADRAGEPLRKAALLYGELFRQFYTTMLTLYTDQYPLFGDARVMPVKVLWDYTYYWGVLCPLFFQQRLTDLDIFEDLEEPLTRARTLNSSMQSLMREWSAATCPREGSARAGRKDMLDQAALPWFAELNRALTDVLHDEEVRARVRENVGQLERLGAEIAGLALRDAPALAPYVPAGVVPNETQHLLTGMI
jgi:flavin-dependent dehydrogenase